MDNIFSNRTDMAVEAGGGLHGLAATEAEIQTSMLENCKCTTVKIKTKAAADIIGKPVGEYATLELPALLGLAGADSGGFGALKTLLASFIPADGAVLVLGLGNQNITPDSLGPQVAEKILATRQLAGESRINLRTVAVIAPGVLGQTGLEVSEVTAALIAEVKPAAVVAVDAFATNSYRRLGCTVQVSNSGVVPGSGVMNTRRELSEKTLGIPVVSIGVPTVVEAVIKDNSANSAKNLLVTPREIDLIIKRSAVLISSALNSCLQKDLSDDELNFLLSES